MLNKIDAMRQNIVEALRDVLEGFPGWSDVALDADGADYRVCASVRGQNVAFLLAVKTGSWRPEAIEKILLRKANVPYVLGAAWIPPKLAKSLRDQGLNYLDTAGNASLNLPALQVFRETEAPPLVDSSRKRPIGEAFNASAVRVGLRLLLNPKHVRLDLRSLAALAGVSAPSAKFALDAFKDDGYVLDAGKRGRHLVEREAFFWKWAESYNLRFRFRHALGRYSCAGRELALECDACWGGEPAARRLGFGLVPEIQVVHVHAAIAPLVARNRLRLDPKGDVELVQACWPKEVDGPQGTAPIFVVFADLLNTRDPRCRDIAEEIFETSIRETLLASAD